MSLPRLCNTYAALQEDFQYLIGADSLLNIAYSVSPTLNTLIKFEPQVNPARFIDGSPLATAMFQRYNQFRIRKITARFTPTLANPQNQGRSDSWVFWCANHAMYDADEAKGEGYSTVTDIAEASRMQHLSTGPGRTFSIDYVPQVIFNNAVSISGVAVDQSGDGKMPWMDSSTANKDTLVLRAPIFFFRRPYLNYVGADAPPIFFQQYQVILMAVVEFRNLSDDN